MGQRRPSRRPSPSLGLRSHLAVAAEAEQLVVAAQTEYGAPLADRGRVIGSPRSLGRIVALVVAHAAQVGRRAVTLDAHL